VLKDVHEFVEVGSSYYWISFKGRLIKTDEQSFYVFPLFLYEWLEHINQLSLLEQIKSYDFDQKIFSYYKIRERSLLEEWVYDFPLLSYPVKDFLFISECFELFLHEKNSSKYEILEKIVIQMSKSLSRETLKEIILFIIHKNDLDKKRIHFLFSEHLRTLLFSK
jgi:hypothetical protein